MLELIQDEGEGANPLSVAGMCQVLGVSRAEYYRWKAAPAPMADHLDLRDGIQRIALEMPAYGYWRITAELRRQGVVVNHKLVLWGKTICCACGKRASGKPPIRGTSVRFTRTLR